MNQTHPSLLLLASQCLLRIFFLHFLVYSKCFYKKYNKTLFFYIFLKMDLRFVKTSVFRLLHFEFFFIVNSYQTSYTIFRCVQENSPLRNLSRFLRHCFSTKLYATQNKICCNCYPYPLYLSIFLRGIMSPWFQSHFLFPTNSSKILTNVLYCAIWN